MVLDPDCGHCKNIYTKIANTGIITDKVALITRWSNEDELQYLLGNRARPTAFPHAIDLNTNARLGVDKLYSVLGI
jgi:hypothetical protein